MDNKWLRNSFVYLILLVAVVALFFTAFPPSGGQVFWGGKDITALPPHLVARLGIARKFQVPGIYPMLTVMEMWPARGGAAVLSGTAQLLC